MDVDVFLTWNRFTATEPSDKARTAKGVTFRANVMELKTATMVKACRLWQKLKQVSVSSSLQLFTSLGQKAKCRNVAVPVLRWDHSPEPCEAWKCTRWLSPPPLEPHPPSGSEHSRPTPGSPSLLIEPLEAQTEEMSKKQEMVFCSMTAFTVSVWDWQLYN